MYKKFHYFFCRFIQKDSFLRHVATLTSGIVIAQAISVLTSPIITRLFTPADFGVISSFMAVYSIISVVSTGRYELAIVLPKEDKDAITLAYLCIYIAFTISLITSTIFIIFNSSVINLLGLEDVPSIWIVLIGLFIFLTGVQNIFTRTSIRNKEFKILATTQVLQTSINNGIKILLGLLKPSVNGLFAGTILGLLSRSFILLWWQRKKIFNIKNIPTFNDMKIQAKRYEKFPIISSWTALLNTASIQIPVILFATFYSPIVAGFYSLSNRILNLPMSLIGRSVGDVFIEKAARISSDKKELSRLTYDIYKKLLIIGTATLSFVTFYGDFVFPMIFGDEWIEAGVYAQWISIALIFQLAMSPISTLFSILEKQGDGLIWSLIIFVIRILSIIIPATFTIGSVETIKTYSIVTALAYLIYGIKVLFLSNVKIVKIILLYCKYIIPFFIGQYFIRSLIIKLWF